jgi:adenylate kinase family enzyme
MRPDLRRVIVIGTSCSGKTTFSRNLSIALGHPHVEFDALYWLPNWVIRPQDEFCKAVEEATSVDRWIVDGNYGNDRELSLTWPRATSVIWLNYSLTVVFPRGLLRTLRRSISREELHSGNRESLYEAFFTRESVLLWMLRTHRQRREQYAAIRRSHRFPHLEWIEFRTPAQAARFLDQISN